MRYRRMEEETETRTIQKWLQIVDKPLAGRKENERDEKTKESDA